jgi:hypothetical protein
MGNPWTEHVKEVAKQKGISYMCAMSMPDTRTSYTPQKQLKKQMKEAKRAEKMKPKEKKVKAVKGKGSAFFLKKIKQKIKSNFLPAFKQMVKVTLAQMKAGETNGKYVKDRYKQISIDNGLEPYFSNYDDRFDYKGTQKSYAEGYYNKKAGNENEWIWDLWTDLLENLFNEYYERSGELEGIEEAFGDDMSKVQDVANEIWYEAIKKAGLS